MHGQLIVNTQQIGEESKNTFQSSFFSSIPDISSLWVILGWL